MPFSIGRANYLVLLTIKAITQLGKMYKRGLTLSPWTCLKYTHIVLRTSENHMNMNTRIYSIFE